MEIVDILLIAVSSSIVVISSVMIISSNYRKCFPVKKETVVYNVAAPDLSNQATQPHEWT